MVKIQCHTDGHCPYQYYCDPKNYCLHDPVFPLVGYPIAVYCLFPIASAICNLSGNSFGEYKVLFLMDFLNYSESQATTLCYPLTVGTAMFNFINLIFKRHPTKDTSAVDFNIIMIIIPSVLYGSTIGALTNKFIPPIVADCLIIVILVAFSIKFFHRYYSFKKQTEKQKIDRQIELSNIRDSKLSEKNEKLLTKQPQKQQITLQEEEVKVQTNPYQKQYEQQINYQKTYHVPHILATVSIFIAFQVLAYLAQGKIIFFTMCTDYYIIGMSCLTVIYFIVIFIIKKYTNNKLNYYRKIGYHYPYRLDNKSFYALLCLGGFLGGFNGGLFALGNSTAIIFFLLYLGVQPVVASATVGFQVVFAGLASLGEAFATDSITVDVVGFFFGVTFVFGGILSYIANQIVSKLNVAKVNQVIMIIIGCLCGSGALSMVANIAISFVDFGKKYMTSIDFSC